MQVATPYWDYVSGAGYYDKGRYYFNCFYITMQVFNPLGVDVMLNKLTPRKIRLNDVYYLPMDISKVKTLQKVQNYDKGVSFADTVTDFNLMPKLKLGINLPAKKLVTFENNLGSLGVEAVYFYMVPNYYDTTKNYQTNASNRNKPGVVCNVDIYTQSTGNKMFELEMNAEYAVYNDVPFSVNNYCYPEKEKIISDKFWQHQVMPAAFFETNKPFMQFPTNLKNYPG